MYKILEYKCITIGVIYAVVKEEDSCSEDCLNENPGKKVIHVGTNGSKLLNIPVPKSRNSVSAGYTKNSHAPRKE